MDTDFGALPRTARDSITAYRMFEQGGRVAVGVSGGADSVALLAFLCSVRDEFCLEPVVCHVNHHLRGSESDGDQQFVCSLAARYGLELCICDFDAAAEAAEAGMGVEEYSRNRRYSFFTQCANEGGKVATAHTLSDAVETVVFNLLRGTGVKGLCGIPRVRENIVRPLRDCTREDVERYLQALGQPYRTDSSNSGDDYSRNFIRHSIIPAMQSLNPSLHAAVGRTMEQMEQQRLMTEQLAERAREEIAEGADCYRRQEFLSLPLPVGNLLLQGWLARSGAVQSEKQISLMRRCAEAGRGATEIMRGVRFAADGQYLRILREAEEQPPFSVELTLPRAGESAEFRVCPGKILKITCYSPENIEFTEKFYNIDLKNLAICDKMKEHVFAHNPRPGDTIFLQGRGHRLFTRYRAGSRGRGAGEISAMVVAEDEDGIVWAEHLGCDERRRADTASAGGYSFEVLEEANP